MKLSKIFWKCHLMWMIQLAIALCIWWPIRMWIWVVATQRFFWFLLPEIWGRWTHFDDIIFFQLGWLKPPTSYRCLPNHFPISKGWFTPFWLIFFNRVGCNHQAGETWSHFLWWSHRSRRAFDLWSSMGRSDRCSFEWDKSSESWSDDLYVCWWILLWFWFKCFFFVVLYQGTEIN